MALFDSLLDTLAQEEAAGPAGGTTVTCPKKRKPALVVLVARQDDATTLDGLQVEITGPTKTSQTTGRDGLARFSTVKAGAHSVLVKLAGATTQRFAPPRAQSVTIPKHATATLLVLLEPLGDIRVQVVDNDTGAFLENILVAAGSEPAVPTTRAGVAEFRNLRAGTYRVRLELPNHLKKQYQLPGPQTCEVVGGRAQSLQIKVVRRQLGRLRLVLQNGAGQAISAKAWTLQGDVAGSGTLAGNGLIDLNDVPLDAASSAVLRVMLEAPPLTPPPATPPPASTPPAYPPAVWPGDFGAEPAAPATFADFTWDVSFAPLLPAPDGGGAALRLANLGFAAEADLVAAVKAYQAVHLATPGGSGALADIAGDVETRHDNP